MKSEQAIPYSEVQVTCSGCGNTFKTGSSMGRPILTEVCAMCHPFYTGQQKTNERSGRIDIFKRKYL